jgi:hypothetical protein
MKKIKICCHDMELHSIDDIEIDHKDRIFMGLGRCEYTIVIKFCPFCGKKIELEDEYPIYEQICTEEPMMAFYDMRYPQRDENGNEIKYEWDISNDKPTFDIDFDRLNYKPKKIEQVRDFECEDCQANELKYKLKLVIDRLNGDG